jgi:hypothetical protein
VEKTWWSRGTSDVQEVDEERVKKKGGQSLKSSEVGQDQEVVKDKEA